MIPLLPVLGAAARFLVSNGGRETIRQFGRKSFEIAKRELAKRQQYIDDAVQRAKTKGEIPPGKLSPRQQIQANETRLYNARVNRLKTEPEITDLLNPPEFNAPLKFADGGGVIDEELPEVTPVQFTNQEIKPSLPPVDQFIANYRQQGLLETVNPDITYDPIYQNLKTGIGSIKEFGEDMIPGVAFKEGLQEGDPTKLTLGGLDLILGANPYVVMFKLGTKPVKALAKKIKNMSPNEIKVLKQKFDDFIYSEKGQLEYKRDHRSSEGRRLRGANKANQEINALEENREILFKDAGVDYNRFGVSSTNKIIARKNRERLKDHPEFEDNPEALDDYIKEFEGENLYAHEAGHVGPERDFSDIPLSYQSESLTRKMFDDFGFEDIDNVMNATPPKNSTTNFFKQIDDNKFILYERNARGKYTQKTLTNPTLDDLRSYFGMAKGGPVEKNIYNDQRLI